MSRSRPTLVLLLACIAQFMLLVDDTITNVALPTIGRDLHFSVANLSWVVNAYLLTFGGLLLVGGRLADRFGPRRVFAISLAGFAAASALCGIAPSSGVLVGARALQGSFGALLSPSALALLLAASPGPAERRRALAIWAGLLGLGAATGLLAGGALVQLADWRWIFLINVPVAAVALAAIPRVLAPDDLGARRRSPTSAAPRWPRCPCSCSSIRSCETDSHPWTSARTLGGLAVALALGVAFVVSERRSGLAPAAARAAAPPAGPARGPGHLLRRGGAVGDVLLPDALPPARPGLQPADHRPVVPALQRRDGDRLGGDGPTAPVGRPASADHHRLWAGRRGPVADGRPHAHQLLRRRRAADPHPHRPGPRPGLRAGHRPGDRRRRGARRRPGLRPDDHRAADRRGHRDRRAHHRGHRPHHECAALRRPRRLGAHRRIPGGLPRRGRDHRRGGAAGPGAAAAPPGRPRRDRPARS